MAVYGWGETVMKIALISLLVSVSLGGCALRPTSDQASTFGKSAVTVGTAYTSAVSLEAALLKSSDIDVAACSYLRHGRTSFPAASLLKPSAGLSERKEFADAVVAYSVAMANATAPSGPAELQTAADNLASSASKFVSALGAKRSTAPASLPIVGPAMQVVSFVGINLFEFQLRSQIRDIATQTHETLLAGILKLTFALREDKRLLSRSYASWKKNRACILRAVRERGSTGGELYKLYLETDAVSRSYEDQLSVMDKMGAAFGGLLEAHAALVNGSADINDTLARFKELADRLSKLKSAAG
jgi:hypothetical protein